MNDGISYKTITEFPIESLRKLYVDAGWTNYTENPNTLVQAYTHSSYVLTAWYADCLVGVLRSVGDSATIMYIQDLIVHSKYQRQGIGRELLIRFLKEYPHVRQKVLLTDNTAKTNGFYQSCGFHAVAEDNCIAYINMGKNQNL